MYISNVLTMTIISEKYTKNLDQNQIRMLQEQYIKAKGNAQKYKKAALLEVIIIKEYFFTFH